MNFAVYLLALLFSGLMKLVPWSILKLLARVIGTTIFYILPLRRKIVLSNIEKTLRTSPVETKKTARAAYVNTARVFLETMKFSRTLPPMTVHGEEHMRNALKKGKGVLLIAGHIGNWELAGSPVGRIGTAYAVGRRIKNPYMDKWIRRNREKRGLIPIYKTSTSASNRQIIKALRQNAIVILVIDQYRPGGHETEFMGIKTRVPEGPYRLAKLTGAAVVSAALTLDNNGTYRGAFYPETEFINDEDPERELALNTANYMLAIEKIIRQFPDQWFWFHNRFKNSPSA